MNPDELVDFRPSEAPLTLWRDMVVLSVHHDTAEEVPAHWKAITDRLACYMLLLPGGL